MTIDRNESAYINVNNLDLFWEPAFTFTVGKTVKYISQIGFCMPIIPLPDEYSYTPRYFMFSTGLEVHLGRNKDKEVK